MPTSAQVSNALRIANLFNILNSSAPINFSNWTDTTDWASIGVSSGAGDTASLIFQTIDPFSQYPYQNAGYQTDNFSSPDATLTDHLSPTYNLFTYSGTTKPIYGNYQIMVKAKVVLAADPSNPIYGYSVFNVELVEGLTPEVRLSETNSCTQLTYTSTDVTNYGLGNYNLTTITRVHTVYPPELSGQSSVTANAATVILGSPDNPLWNATYEASLAVTLTYTKNGNTFITHAATSTERAVSCVNDLCALKCCLETLETGWNTHKGKNSVLAQEYLSRFLLCSSLYTLVQADLLCGADTSTNITAFYDAAAPYCDKDCNCGCSDEPGPAQASNILQGPVGPAGPVGPIGATGATGPAGPTGADGGGLLYNNFANAATTAATTWQTLDSYQIPAATLTTNGDETQFEVVYTTPSNTDPQQNTRLLFNGNSLMDAAGIPISFYAPNIQKIIVSGRIVRVSNTEANVQLQADFVSDGFTVLQTVVLPIQAVVSLNFTTTAYTLAQQAYSAVIGDIVSESMEVIYNRFGITTSGSSGIAYIVPFVSTAGTTVYANIIGTSGKTMKRIYLDGVLLVPSDWSYNNTTDTLTFNISITGASEIEGDYI